MDVRVVVDAALRAVDILLRLVVVAMVMAVAATAVAAATTETSSSWDRYQGSRKLASHPSREACVAAVPTPGVQQCRVRITVTKTADPPPTPTPTPATWTDCAREGSRCAFTGRREVRYTAAAGAGVRQITKVADGGVQCDDWPFAAPTTNYENVCSYSSATTTAPVSVVLTPPTPAPTPTPTPTPTPRRPLALPGRGWPRSRPAGRSWPRRGR